MAFSSDYSENDLPLLEEHLQQMFDKKPIIRLRTCYVPHTCMFLTPYA